MVLIPRLVDGTQFGETLTELKRPAVRTRLNMGKEDLESKRKTPKCLLCHSNSTIGMLHFQARATVLVKMQRPQEWEHSEPSPMLMASAEQFTEQSLQI